MGQGAGGQRPLGQSGQQFGQPQYGSTMGGAGVGTGGYNQNASTGGAGGTYGAGYGNAPTGPTSTGVGTQAGIGMGMGPQAPTPYPGNTGLGANSMQNGGFSDVALDPRNRLGGMQTNGLLGGGANPFTGGRPPFSADPPGGFFPANGGGGFSAVNPYSNAHPNIQGLSPGVNSALGFLGVGNVDPSLMNPRTMQTISNQSPLQQAQYLGAMQHSLERKQGWEAANPPGSPGYEATRQAMQSHMNPAMQAARTSAMGQFNTDPHANDPNFQAARNAQPWGQFTGENARQQWVNSMTPEQQQAMLAQLQTTGGAASADGWWNSAEGQRQHAQLNALNGALNPTGYPPGFNPKAR